MPSRIVICERESEAQDPTAPGTSDAIVPIDDVEEIQRPLIGECG